MGSEAKEEVHLLPDAVIQVYDDQLIPVSPGNLPSFRLKSSPSFNSRHAGTVGHPISMREGCPNFGCSKWGERNFIKTGDT